MAVLLQVIIISQQSLIPYKCPAPQSLHVLKCASPENEILLYLMPFPGIGVIFLR